MKLTAKNRTNAGSRKGTAASVQIDGEGVSRAEGK